MRFHLPSALRKWAGDKEIIDVSMPLDVRMTIVEAVEMLGRDYPGIRQRVLDDQGGIRRRTVNVFVDGENVRFAQGNDTQVTHSTPRSGCSYPAMSGG